MSPILALLAAAGFLVPTQTAEKSASKSAGEPAGRAGTLIVLDKSAATLSLIDVRTGERFHTAPTGTGPHEVAVSPDGETAVVCNYGDQQPGNTLTVFDIEGRAVRRTVDLGEHRRPHGIVFETSDHVLVTCEDSGALLRVDIGLGEVVQTIPTEQSVSHMVVLDRTRRRAYVANIGSGSITAIDLSQDKIVGQVATGKGAEGIDVTPDGRQIWVANRAEDTVSVIDAATLTVAAKLPCGQFPIRVKVTPDGRHALVSNAQSGDVAVFDVEEREEVGRFGLGLDAAAADGTPTPNPVPVGILIEPSGQRAFVAAAKAGAVVPIDLATWKPVGRLDAGREPDGMAWSPLAPPPAAKR